MIKRELIHPQHTRIQLDPSVIFTALTKVKVGRHRLIPAVLFLACLSVDQAVETRLPDVEGDVVGQVQETP